MKIALFVHYGASAEMERVPEDCPPEYVYPENRHKFALWLEENASEDGLFLIDRRDDGIVIYEYLYNDEHAINELVRVAVVQVNTSRPWLIHVYDGWETIWYLDKKVEHNQLVPERVPKFVGNYRYGEEEQKINILYNKLWELRK